MRLVLPLPMPKSIANLTLQFEGKQTGKVTVYHEIKSRAYTWVELGLSYTEVT